jgi:hypothetical protein
MAGSVEVALAEDRLDTDGELWVPDVPDPTEERECTAPFMITPYIGPSVGVFGLACWGGGRGGKALQ